MADPRRLELDELVNRPGTYFNPQTEVLVVVDDSPELDAEIFNMEEFEGADWVLISEEVPIDENSRDELLERFQVRYQPVGGGIAHAEPGLEGLQELVPPVLVDGHLVGDQHPVGALELLHVEDLGVQLGGVVDDDEHLRLRIEVGARAVDELLELEAAGISHGAAA